MPSNRPKIYSITEAAKILGVTGRNPQDIELRLISRLAFLGYTEECGRCKGTGQHSFNPLKGTNCFACSGTGRKLLKLTPSRVNQAEGRIADGDLVPYFKRHHLIREVKSLVKEPWTAWKHSALAKAYYTTKIPPGLDDAGRAKYYDEFFSSHLFMLNKGCGDICSRASEIESLLEARHKLRDGEELDRVLAELVGMKERVEEIDRQYVMACSKPIEVKPVFALFRYLGIPHFVRVNAPTDNHIRLAREYLAKVIPNRYYEKMIFDSWADEAPEFHDLYPRPDGGMSRKSLTEFLENLSESREVIEDAVRE